MHLPLEFLNLFDRNFVSKMAKRTLITCLLIAGIATAVSGCGMSLHNEVTVRALSDFSPVIAEYEKYADFIREYPTFVQVRQYGNFEYIYKKLMVVFNGETLMLTHTQTLSF